MQDNLDHWAFVSTPSDLPLNLDQLPTVDGATDGAPTPTAAGSPVVENPCIESSIPVLEVTEEKNTEGLWIILHVVL